MNLEPKVVLKLPVADIALLVPFVEQCLQDNVSLIAIVGDGCVKMEDAIDDLIVGDGIDEGRFITTSSHPGESLAEVLEFAKNWWISADGEVRLITL